MATASLIGSHRQFARQLGALQRELRIDLGNAWQMQERLLEEDFISRNALDHDAAHVVAAARERRVFEKLYNHIKSAIHYASGLKGKFNSSVPYNIETLVDTLYELERNEQHPLYPFIASWNSRIVSLAGPEFENIKTFRSLLLKQLKKWMCAEDPTRGDYYAGLINLQRELNFPLRIGMLPDGCKILD